MSHILMHYGVDSFSLTNYDDERADTLRLHCKDPAKVKAFIEASQNAVILQRNCNW